MLNFRDLKDRIFQGLVIVLTVVMFLPLVHIIITVVANGLPVLMERGATFITAPLSEGGIGPAIVGSFLLTFLASLLGIPIALLVGIYAYEYPRSIVGNAVNALLQIMLEFPTILVGIFVMYVFVFPMGTYSALAGAFALTIILIPYVAVYTQEAMRGIPHTYREAAFSLGLDRVKSVFRVLVPIARKGITTGILIGIAKVAGETAPILFTAGGLYQSYPQSVTEPVGAISLLIYTLVQSPSPADHSTAWGASLVLLGIFLMIFLPIRMSIKEVKL